MPASASNPCKSGGLVQAGLVDAGAARPERPVDEQDQHLAPRASLPAARSGCAGDLAPRRLRADGAAGVLPRYMEPEWMEQGVLDVVKLG